MDLNDDDEYKHSTQKSDHVSFGTDKSSRIPVADRAEFSGDLYIPRSHTYIRREARPTCSDICNESQTLLTLAAYSILFTVSIVCIIFIITGTAPIVAVWVGLATGVLASLFGLASVSQTGTQKYERRRLNQLVKGYDTWLRDYVSANRELEYQYKQLVRTAERLGNTIDSLNMDKHRVRDGKVVEYIDVMIHLHEKMERQILATFFDVERFGKLNERDAGLTKEEFALFLDKLPMQMRSLLENNPILENFFHLDVETNAMMISFIDLGGLIDEIIEQVDNVATTEERLKAMQDAGQNAEFQLIKRESELLDVDAIFQEMGSPNRGDDDDDSE